MSFEVTFLSFSILFDVTHLKQQSQPLLDRGLSVSLLNLAQF